MNATNSSVDNEEYYDFRTISEVFMLGFALLSVATVLNNGMFLWTFYKDPLKCLRTPSAIFMAGLSISNFLTGLIGEPAVVIIIALSLVNFQVKDIDKFYRFTGAFYSVTITSSFLIMLALGIVQYLLIKNPRVYGKIVSPKSAIIGVIFIFVYSIFFAVLPEMTGIDIFVFYAVELVVHNTVLTVVVVILYIMIYFAFRRLAQRHRDADLNENAEEQGPVTDLHRRQAEKEFIYGTIMLAVILIITVWPYCIILFVALFGKEFSLTLSIAWMVTEFFMMWKFAVDPFVFAWRLRKYRKSLIMVMQRSCSCFKPTLPGATYQRHFSETTAVAALSETSDLDNDSQLAINDSTDATNQQPASA